MEHESHTDLLREPSLEDAREALRRRAVQARTQSARVHEAYRATVQASLARRQHDREVEFAVASAAHGGDAAARDALLWRFAPFVSALAREHSEGSPVRHAELVSAGFTSVLTAVDGWDPARGARFRDYALDRARTAIQTHPVDVRRPGDLPFGRHGRAEGG